jgi:hypothetical protein
MKSHLIAFFCGGEYRGIRGKEQEGKKDEEGKKDQKVAEANK